MLFSRGGCTQGFNTFKNALKGGVLNPFGTNKNLGYSKMLDFGIVTLTIEGEKRLNSRFSKIR
jgi:hypothetical protein